MRQLAITLTDEQVDALDAAVLQDNANIAAFNATIEARITTIDAVGADESPESPDAQAQAADLRLQMRPPETFEAALQRRIDGYLRDEVAHHQQRQVDDLIAQLRALPDAERQAAKAQIKALVKGTK